MSLSQNLTRGGLTPAKFTNLATNEVIHFMFNPHTYTLSKSNEWKPDIVKGLNVPRQTFLTGGSIKLELTNVIFDTYAENKDVRTITNKLWKLMFLANNENAETHKGSPAQIAFEWGTLYFKAIIKTMSQKFTMFNADGMPVRCEVTITLEQHHDDTNQPPQTVVTTPATRLGVRLGMTAMLGIAVATATASAIITAVTSDRIDHVAKKTTGDAGNMRQVAERNNVDNPLKVKSGQTFS